MSAALTVTVTDVTGVTKTYAADKTAERILELRGAMANLRAERDRLAALQSKMDDELANIFTEQNWD